MKKVALIGAASTIVTALVVVLASSSVIREGKVGLQSARACSKADPADCLPALDFADLDGTIWAAEALAGKVVMINFWATWCGPCQVEIPDLTATYQRYANAGFVLLGIMTDADAVSRQELDAFSQRFNLDYPVVPLDADIWREFGAPDALPTTLLYDRAGNLRLRHRGPLDESSLRTIVEQLLDEPALPES